MNPKEELEMKFDYLKKKYMLAEELNDKLKLDFENRSEFDALYKQTKEHFLLMELGVRDITERLKLGSRFALSKSKNQFYMNKCAAILAIVWLELGQLMLLAKIAPPNEYIKYFEKIRDIKNDYRKPEFVNTYLLAMDNLGVIHYNRQDYTMAKSIFCKNLDIYKMYSQNGFDPPLSPYEIFDWAYVKTGNLEDDEDQVVQESELYKCPEGCECERLEETDEQIARIEANTAELQRKYDIHSGTEIFEKNYTHATFYLAQVYKGLNLISLSAKYCHITLNRLIKFHEYDHIDWALNAATLSQSLMEKKRFVSARHHLAAATAVLNSYENVMLTDSVINDEERAARQETFNHRQADIYRCWAKYGLELLSASKEHLLTTKDMDIDYDDEPELSSTTITNNDNNNNTAAAAAAIKNQEEIDDEDASSQDLTFTVDLKLTELEKSMPAKYCLVYADATTIFNAIQNYLALSEKYYTLETEASEYAKIREDAAEAYRILIFFVDDLSTQCKLYKRSADILENLLSSLNIQFYIDVFRLNWYELGSIYSAMLYAKLEIYEQVNHCKSTTRFSGESVYAIQKMHIVGMKAVDSYTKYINSFKKPNANALNDGLSEDQKETVLFAYFYIGRLYYKMKALLPKERLQNLENALNYYQKFVTECKRFSVITNKRLNCAYVSTTEIISLLPLKIKQLRQCEQ